ncbi:MAG TPA: cytochrome c biogenesis protein CcdA [Candidatus Eisenbacteria bacterium]|nr:cytochrome c biogenesis protein CcdA [Candidatus Eisenbacteria bacterium]
MNVLTRFRPLPVLALALAFSMAPARAQDSTSASSSPPSPQDLVTLVVDAPQTAAPGQSVTATIRAQIRSGWHVNANPPSADYMVPTKVELTLPTGYAHRPPIYPKGESHHFAFADEPLSVYEGAIQVKVPFGVAASAKGLQVIHGVFRYQSCNDELCLAPASKPFEIRFTVAGKPAAPVAGTQSEAPPPPAPATPLEPVRAVSTTNPIQRAFDEHGLLAFFLIFLFGLSLNLTPCVYPMMSVTLALFGSREEKSLVKRVPAALVYMLGIAVTYSVLGVVAAFTGSLFGAALQNPIVDIAIALVLVIMALSLFGLYELQVPSSLLSRLSGNSFTGLAGVFFSGLLVGLFAAPCTGPTTVALLAVVAQSGKPLFGFLVFFVLALGLGVPYLILGTYTGLLQRLPRSGMWMVWVKKAFGILLIAVALFYVSLVVAPASSGWVTPVALVLGGLYLGFLEHSARGAPGFTRFQRLAGTIAVALGVWMAVSTPTQGVEWAPFTSQRLAEATRAGKPVVLDFYADWCIPCHELDRSTFTHPKVRQALARFVALKVDLTTDKVADVQALRTRFGVNGVPTVLFLTPEGNEVPDTRVVGFLPPSDFAARAARAASAASVAARPTGTP